MFSRVLFSAERGTRITWLLVLGVFMVITWLANSWAVSDASKGLQYLGLVLYIIAEAIIFTPLLFVAAYASEDPYVIEKAGIVTLGLFLGITATVFLTRTDFSFLGPILAIGGFAALGFIVASAIFGFTLGNVFAFVMVAFAGTAILYQTSNVLHRFRTDQHVMCPIRPQYTILHDYILIIPARALNTDIVIMVTEESILNCHLCA
jgi:FtsH-binding integral membrane protein